jgi:hypothetical protein
MKVVAEDVGGGGRNEGGGGGVGVEEVVLPLLFFAHAGLDTALAGTSKADLKRTWLLQCSAALSSQGTRPPPLLYNLLSISSHLLLVFLFDVLMLIFTRHVTHVLCGVQGRCWR